MRRTRKIPVALLGVTGTSARKVSWVLCAAACLSADAAWSAPGPSGQLCSDIASTVSADRRGRLIIGGTAYDNRVLEWESGHAHFGDFALARLLPNGRPDPNFGVGGNVIWDVGDFDDVSDVSVSRNGIDVAGTTAQRAGDRRGSADLVIARLTREGSFDHRFGEAGIARIDLGGSESVASVIATPADGLYAGGLYVIGTTTTDADSNGFVLRLTPEGTLDRSFGRDGIALIDTGSADDSLLGAAVLPHGIVLGGKTSLAGEAAAFAARLDHQGTLQQDFGSGGISLVAVGGPPGFEGTSSHTLAGASAVSLTRTAPDGTAQAATVLFDSQGAPRPTPDGGHVRILDVPGAIDAPGAAAFGWGGSLYLGGVSYSADFATGDAFIARLGADGTVDTTFAGGARVEHLELDYAAFNDIDLSGSRPVAVGWEFSEQPELLPRSDALLARYRSDGSLDPSFGNQGIVLHDFHAGAALCGPHQEIE